MNSKWLEKAKELYSQFENSLGEPVFNLHETVLNVCASLADSQSKFATCVNESAKITRKKIANLRKTMSSQLKAEVNDEIITKVIEELNTVKTPDGKALGELKRNLVMSCAKIAKNVDDFFTCIDEGEKISQILSSDLK